MNKENIDYALVKMQEIGSPALEQLVHEVKAGALMTVLMGIVLGVVSIACYRVFKKVVANDKEVTDENAARAVISTIGFVVCGIGSFVAISAGLENFVSPHLVLLRRITGS